MKLRIEYNNKLPDNLTILQTKKHHSYVDKIKNLFKNPYSSNIIIAQDGSSFSPIELKHIYYFFTESKAVYVKSASGKHKVQERLYELESQLPHEFF